uniref:Uncharacterized protein n=1 Tax=Lepeophtheirus salmonis TaxID=72036 RepID=A0A0K2U3T7_LEPSM
MVSIWPGPVKTEEITNRVLENPEARNSAKRTFESGESTEFTGMAIVKLASHPNTIQCTGKILLTSFLARKYDIKDLNGTITGDMFSLKNILQVRGHNWISSLIPSFITIPTIFIHYLSNKF